MYFIPPVVPCSPHAVKFFIYLFTVNMVILMTRIYLYRYMYMWTFLKVALFKLHKYMINIHVYNNRKHQHWNYRQVFFFTLHKSAVFKGFVHCFTAIKAGSSAHCSPQRLPGVSAEGMSGTERWKIQPTDGTGRPRNRPTAEELHQVAIVMPLCPCQLYFNQLEHR